MKVLISILAFTFVFVSYGQLKTDRKSFSMPIYNKAKTLDLAKTYLIESILVTDKNSITFTIDPLVSATSGELTTISYQCDELKKSGIIFGFWGIYITEAGVEFKGCSFYDLSQTEMEELAILIDKVLEEQKAFLYKNPLNNHVSFKYKELNFIFYIEGNIRSRVFYGEFDAEWNYSEFKKSLKKMDKNLD